MVPVEAEEVSVPMFTGDVKEPDELESWAV
jgi:hypothetical protein